MVAAVRRLLEGEAVEGARLGQGQRLEAVREVATKRQEVADLHEETPRLMAELQARYAQIDEELMQALERWEALDSR